MSTARYRWLTLLLLALIAHGSIYPWHFVEPASVADAFVALMAQRQWWSNRSDVIENVVLFVPLGALWAWSRGRLRDTAARDWVPMVVGSIGFSYLLQVIQIWLPDRDAQLSDVLWNTVGQALGVALGFVLRAPLGALSAVRGLPPAAPVMLVLWVALEAFPFVPTLDWQHVKDAIKPLLLNPAWSTRSALDTALGIVVLAQLLREVRHRGVWIAGLIAVAVLAKPIVMGLSYSPGHAAGWMLGALLAPLVWRVPAYRSGGLGVVLALVWFTVDELRPFDLVEHPNPFHWMPFAALLLGSVTANVLALLHDLFWLGAAMVLGRRQGARSGPLAVGLAVWVLLLEAAQTLLPQRIPDVTVALLPLAWWLWLRAVDPAAPKSAEPVRRRRRHHHRPA